MPLIKLWWEESRGKRALTPRHNQRYWQLAFSNFFKLSFHNEVEWKEAMLTTTFLASGSLKTEKVWGLAPLMT